MHFEKVVVPLRPEVAARIFDPKTHDKLVRLAQEIRGIACRLAHAEIVFGLVEQFQFKVGNQFLMSVDVADRGNEVCLESGRRPVLVGDVGRPMDGSYLL